MTPPVKLAPRPVVSASAQADEAVREVLLSQHRAEPVVLVESPPGAGKTGLVVRAAAYAAGVLGERCVVAVQTNEQAFDLVRRLKEAYRSVPVVLFARQGLDLPLGLAGTPGLSVVRKTADLPAGPGITVANSSKLGWVSAPYPHFDLLVVDEAYQLTSARFEQIRGLADRHLLVGDPGQIPPVVSCEVERWEGDPAAPHVRAPDALVATDPGLLRFRLPVSRRLMPDTVGLIQPAFYPDLPFVALSRPGDRRLRAVTWSSTGTAGAVRLACSGASVVGIELPEQVTGEEDPGLADAVVDFLRQLFLGRAEVYEGGEVRTLSPDRVGVVCAHVAQVAAVQERLPLTMRGVLVETADRFQGLERDVVLVHHPLSGRAHLTPFHLDPGRLCVMLSRHRVACFVLYRDGVGQALDEYVPSAERPLGATMDREHAGWAAHRRIARELVCRAVSV